MAQVVLPNDLPRRGGDRFAFDERIRIGAAFDDAFAARNILDHVGEARELAAVLGGEIGCTRPLSEEMHWLPEEACIGLSGAQVKPDLYMGVGVSGQIQHVTGIRNARVICAVNKDEHAPIFSVADYGIVGDLYEVVPKLIQKLKQM